LANLLQAGMPLTVALNSMTHLESKGIPKDVSSGLRQEVMEGRSLSDSMAKQPLIFSDLYVNMVRAGEQSGALVDVLRRMANHFERYAEVQGKLKSALIYDANEVPDRGGKSLHQRLVDDILDDGARGGRDFGLPLSALRGRAPAH